MANQVVNRQLNVYVNSGEAKKAYDILIEREKRLNEELKKTADPKRIEVLRKELAKLSEPIDRATKKMKGELAPSIRELEHATRKFLNEFKKTGDPAALAQFQRMNKALTEQRRQINSLSDAQGKLNRQSSAFGGVANITKGFLFAGGIEGAANKLTEFLKSSVAEFFEAEERIKMLENSLENVGKGQALDAFLDKSKQIADHFKFIGDDDVVESFTKLNDFGRLTQKQIFELEPVIVNLATKLRTDIPTATDIMINSLAGRLSPELKRLGASFKDADSTADRLAVIMTTVKDKVEGAGDAFKQTAQGRIAVFRQSIKDTKEDVGEFTVSFLPDMNDSLLGFATNLTRIFRGPRQELAELKRLAESFKTISRGGLGNAALGLFNSTKSEFDILQEQNRSDKDETKKTVKETKDELKELMKELAKMRQQLNLSMLPAFEREMKALDIKFDELRKRAKGNTDALKEIEDLYQEERFRIVQEYARRQVNEWKKSQTDILSSAEKSLTDAIKKFNDKRKTRGIDPNDPLDLPNDSQDQKKDEEDRKAVFQAKLNMYIGYLQSVQNISSLFGQMASNREENELARDRRVNDQKRANLDRRLKAGTISQRQYDLEIQKIERAQEKREREIRIRQFNRQKRADIVQALINGALAVTSTLAAKPGPLDIATFGVLRAVQVGLAIATTAAQVAAIASQKPTFARGGTFGGRSHAEGGNAVIDGSGRKIAEVEAGEAIINKKSMRDGRRYTVSGTPSQIASRINSLHGGINWETGGDLSPSWSRLNTTRMNIPALRRMYAQGGVFINGSDNEGSQSGIFENLLAAISDMQATQASLQQTLAGGISAYILLTQQERQQERMVSIRRDATMQG